MDYFAKHHQLKQSNSAGFTLLELLIAIFIFSIISIAAFISLSQTQQANAKTKKIMQRLNKIQTTIRKLEQDISQIIARPIRDRYGNNLPAVIFQQNDYPYLEFTRTGIDASTNKNHTNLQRVAYFLKNATLYRRVWFQLDRADKTSKTANRPLLDGVKQLRFRFYDQQKQTFTNWPADKKLIKSIPLAIEISLELEKNGQLIRTIEINN